MPGARISRGELYWIALGVVPGEAARDAVSHGRRRAHFEGRSALLPPLKVAAWRRSAFPRGLWRTEAGAGPAGDPQGTRGGDPLREGGHPEGGGGAESFLGLPYPTQDRREKSRLLSTLGQFKDPALNRRALECCLAGMVAGVCEQERLTRAERVFRKKGPRYGLVLRALDNASERARQCSENARHTVPEVERFLQTQGAKQPTRR